MRDLFKSIGGTMCTVILGRITAITANEVSALLMIIVATLTAIHTILKIVDWRYRWKNRKNQPLNPPHQYEKEDD